MLYAAAGAWPDVPKRCSIEWIAMSGMELRSTAADDTVRTTTFFVTTRLRETLTRS